MSVSAGVDARHNIGLVSRELEKSLRITSCPKAIPLRSRAKMKPSTAP